MIYLSVKDELIRKLSKSFEPKIKFDRRIRVVSDLLMFRPKDDISVWKQLKGQAPEYFTVYFDDEYICGFDASQSIDYAILEFWRGFKKQYANGTIHLNPKPIEEAPIIQPKKKPKATTPIEKMAVEVVDRMNKK